MSNNERLTEYKDISDNVRHYGNIHFVQLTILITITAGILALLFTSNPPLSIYVKNVIQYAGLIVTILFYIIIESSLYLWKYFVKRAAELEKTLAYEQYSKLTDKRIFKYRPGTCGIRIFCFILIVFWIFTICCDQQF